MSLKRDREPVLVRQACWLTYWHGFYAVWPTRYVIQKDGWLQWVHPVDCYRSNPTVHYAHPNNWRKGR